MLYYRLTDLAMNDILDFQKFLSVRYEKDNIIVIKKRIDKSILTLRQFSGLGYYDGRVEARVFAVSKTSYVLVFRVKNNILEILRIYHTSRDKNFID